MTTSLVEFDGASMVSMWTIKLEITVGDRLLTVEFVIINATSLYNIIKGRGWNHFMEGTVHITLGDEVCIRQRHCI